MHHPAPAVSVPRGRDWGNTSTSQGPPRTASHPQEPAEAGRSLPWVSEGAGPAHALTSDLQPPDRRNVHWAVPAARWVGLGHSHLGKQCLLEPEEAAEVRGG